METDHLLAGRYEVRSLIGRGGMAQVHLGRDTRLGRDVAIKMLRTELARDPVFQERFRREAQAAASLNHPNIVAVYDTGTEPLPFALRDEDGPAGATSASRETVPVPYIVMEYVQGRTIKEMLAADGIPPRAEAVRIIVGVLSALEAAHAAGLVHRDIKPGNIMVSSDGSVKVMDFGIARALDSTDAALTQTNAVVGTAQYLSPEQARGQQVDARSDLYATGVVLFELLTGRPPFTGESPLDVAYQHVTAAPPLPSSINPDLPRGLDEVVLRALTKDRDARYQTASDMRADLIRATSDQQVSRQTAVTAATTAAITPTVGLAAATSAMPVPRTAPSPARDTTATWSATETPNAATMGMTGPGGNLAPRRRTGLVVLAVLVLAIASGLVAWALGNRAAADLVAVPDVAGRSVQDAEDALTAQGLTVGDITPIDGSSQPEGIVDSTNPAAGTRVAVGTTVTILVSSGRESSAPPTSTTPSTPRPTQTESTPTSTPTQTQPPTPTSTPTPTPTPTRPPTPTPTNGGSQSGG